MKHDLDIRIIGSDISRKAIETAANNIDFAKVDSLSACVELRDHPIMNEPFMFAQHWPAIKQEGVVNYGDKSRKTCMSLYHGDFQKVGALL